MKTMRLGMTLTLMVGVVLAALVLVQVFQAWLNPLIALAMLDGLILCR